MTVQHRKNKSVLNNQIRINPSLQPNAGLRASGDSSGKQKLNQYFDNYTDHTNGNYYMQQPVSGGQNLSSNSNLGSASL